MKYVKLLIAICTISLIACEKEIDFELPEVDKKIVVEGKIEQGLPPFVMLTKTVGYFEDTDINTLQSLFIHNATVTVSNGTFTETLTEICTSEIEDSLLPTVAELIGVTLNELETFGFCLYTTLNPAMFGEVGKSYALTIEAEGKTLTSTTTIPTLVYMDSYYYKDQPGYSDYGYLWFKLNDPPIVNNAYRIFTKRGEQDEIFIPANGSVFDDHFFNGLNFEAFIFRGHINDSKDPADYSETADYFHQGDTIIIKFCSIDQPHFEFLSSFEIASFNNGNPFVAPAQVQTNIEGGLGVWGGYGVTYDTLIAVD